MLILSSLCAFSAELTADELLAKARSAYSEANWKVAAGLYQTFLANYGDAKEVERLLPDLRYDASIALLQNQAFSAANEIIQTLLSSLPALPLPRLQEITFWLGVCQMQEQKYPEARATFEKFIALIPLPKVQTPLWIKQNPAAAKLPEARLLIGATFLLEGKFVECADYFKISKSDLPEETQGRATVLELFALVSAGSKDAAQRERALELVIQEFPTQERLTQLVGFQSLTLELGAKFLEHGEYRKAIRCLQRIWSAERLLKHQKNRLDSLETRSAALKANPHSDAFQKLQVEQMLVKVRREVETFQAIPDFDPALRLRLASAYQAMHRYREAALILADVVEHLPANSLRETSTIALVQCWSAMERWPAAIASAEDFAKKFPKSEKLPLVSYQRGIAEQKSQQYEAAIKTFHQISKTFPKNEFAPRALFMAGFTQLLAEKNNDTIQVFTEFVKKFPKHELREAALYWKGMAYSLDGQYEKSREVLAAYLKAFPKGAYAGAAKFRRAYAAQQLMDFPTAMKELEAFLKAYPGHEQDAEAWILLGDARMNEGLMEEGLTAFANIPPEKTRFFEEGWFKAGKALKLMEEYDRLREHMMKFRQEYPKSQRVAEALFHAGWVYRQQGQEEEARRLYWEAIEQYGNDAEMRNIEDLFPALQRLYAGKEEVYREHLRELRAGKEQGVLAMRCLWAESLALRKSDPELARLLLLQAARIANVSETNPLLLADFAEARLAIGDQIGGTQMLQDLLKWNPRSPQKDRALAELGISAMKQGDTKAAKAYFERFMKETVRSRQTGKVLLAKAGMESKRSEWRAAKESLETLLASEMVSGPEKAEALFQLGEIQMHEGKPQLAVPYYQRIYIMHARWRDWVAKAYLRSGEAFEKIQDFEAARKTYAELLAQPDLVQFHESKLAREHLEKLGETSQKLEVPAS